MKDILDIIVAICVTEDMDYIDEANEYWGAIEQIKLIAERQSVTS